MEPHGIQCDYDIEVNVDERRLKANDGIFHIVVMVLSNKEVSQKAMIDILDWI